MGRMVTAKDTFLKMARPTTASAMMLHGPRDRIVGGLALVVLMIGFLATSADASLNHPNHIPSRNPTCHRNTLIPHIDRELATDKLPPCNVCFFHNLVAHSLIPQRDRYVPASPLARFYQPHRTVSSEFFFPDQDNRGPPASRNF